MKINHLTITPVVMAHNLDCSATGQTYALNTNTVSTHHKQIKKHWRKYKRAINKDTGHNRKVDRNKPHIIILRQYDEMENYNWHYLDWLDQFHPERSRLFLRVRLPALFQSLRNVKLIVPWVQDPFKERFRSLYYCARLLQERGLRKDIPVINPVQELSISIKSKALPLIRQFGPKTADTFRINNIDEFKKTRGGMELPLFIREDEHHGGHYQLINKIDEINTIDWEKYSSPVAIKFLNVCDQNGLYRKYRYVLFGNTGVNRHLVISDHWFVHANNRVTDEKARREEVTYMHGKDSNHEIFNTIRKAMKLDTVAFDYSYGLNGELVIWEPNPLPTYWSELNNKEEHDYQKPVINHLYTELTNFYLRRAGLEDYLITEE